MFDDAETSVGFPSPKNCCYRANPGEPVALQHQISHCLSSHYRTCPVIQSAVPGPLPPSLRYSAGAGGIGKIFRWGLVVAVVLALILLGIYSLWARTGVAGTLPEVGPPVVASAIFPPSDSESPPTGTTIPAGEPGLEATPTPMMTATQFQGIVSGPLSATPSPLIPPSSVPGACPPPPGWSLYTVQPNDTLFGLSVTYNVSISVLEEANCLETSIIFVGQQLYVPPLEGPVLPPSATGIPPSPMPTQTVIPSQTSIPATLTPTIPPITRTPLPSPTQTPLLPTAGAEVTPLIQTPTQVP